ncbi:hypothetical protein EX30DRAFT_123770 [Ascodesmis nigricans]|uniref:Uncharacterized protein n=1 Tax=Ascodesmis nigricans TaxID=341454 RepID=A0A4S2MPB7_9PEZI|nr:hypothetical protein EX30DRAFT_123770 [Ascodesmis nigricans]
MALLERVRTVVQKVSRRKDRKTEPSESPPTPGSNFPRRTNSDSSFGCIDEAEFQRAQKEVLELEDVEMCQTCGRRVATKGDMCVQCFDASFHPCQQCGHKWTRDISGFCHNCRPRVVEKRMCQFCQKATMGHPNFCQNCLKARWMICLFCHRHGTTNENGRCDHCIQDDLQQQAQHQRHNAELGHPLAYKVS